MIWFSPADALSSMVLDKLFAQMPLSPSSIVWNWPDGGDALKLGR